jgi:hypothetical protein
MAQTTCNVRIRPGQEQTTRVSSTNDFQIVDAPIISLFCFFCFCYSSSLASLIEVSPPEAFFIIFTSVGRYAGD